MPRAHSKKSMALCSSPLLALGTAAYNLLSSAILIWLLAESVSELHG